MTSFSVLMSVYRGERWVWLDESLRSILEDQSLCPDQLVLVCDGALTDDLERVIAVWSEKASIDFYVHRLEENHGLGFCLNEGLKLCRNEIVARMDSDDICFPDRFRKQLCFLDRHPEIGVVGSYSVEIDGNGGEKGLRSVPENSIDIYETMWTCPLIHPSVMFRKSVVLKAGSYSISLKRRQDYDLWFRCARLGALFHNLPEPLIYYRTTDESYKKNSLSIAWLQAMIGLKGSWMLSLGPRAYLGVFFPVIKALLPRQLRRILENVLANFDPRRTKG